jgi:TPR repeat protein
VLKRDYPSLFEQVKLCYQAAVDDGIYEAANNLGILAYHIEDNMKEALKQLSFAASHGSQNAMINMFTIYWSNEDYKKAIKLLKEMPQKKNPSLKCLWNLSVLSYYGKWYPHNTIKKDDQKAMTILNTIIGYNRDNICENEKNVPKKAEEFLEYIELPF